MMMTPVLIKINYGMVVECMCLVLPVYERKQNNGQYSQPYMLTVHIVVVFVTVLVELSEFCKMKHEFIFFLSLPLYLGVCLCLY